MCKSKALGTTEFESCINNFLTCHLNLKKSFNFPKLHFPPLDKRQNKKILLNTNKL